MALVAGLLAAVYFLIGSYSRFDLGESTLEYAIKAYAAATLTTGVYSIVSRVNIVNYSSITHLYFVLMAIIPMILGHTVMNYMLSSLRTHIVTSISLGEPIGAGILAHFILGQRIGITQWVFRAVILITVFTANYISGQ